MKRTLVHLAARAVLVRPAPPPLFGVVHVPARIAGPSSAPSHTGRNEREIAPGSGPGNS